MLGRWWWRPNTEGQLWPKDRSIRSFDGTRIRYTILGPADGPIVTTCAGFLCPDTFWKYLVPGLTPRYRVLVWNYRGVGVSDLPRNPGFHAVNLSPKDLSVEANAKDLGVILDQEGITDTVLIGHSMGVQTALEAYRRFPQPVAGLVSLAGTYRSPLRTFYGTDLSARIVPVALPLLHVFPRATLLLWRALIRSPASYPAARHLLRATGPGVRPGDLTGYFEHLSMSDPLIGAKMIRGMHEHSAEDLLGEIDVPVLVCHGTADPFTPPRVARAMIDRIPEAEVAWVEEGSHTLPIEQPDEILRPLEAFLGKAFARVRVD